jgi:hypothetical protein
MKVSHDQESLYIRAMSTRFGNAWLGLALVAICLASGIAGCGGGSSSSSGASSEGRSGAGPSAEFLKPKGKNEIATFGQEAPPELREAASAIVTESLKARAAADFATQCETLNMKGIADVPGAENHSDCPKALRAYAEPLANSKKIRADTLSGPIAAFRVKGDQGYAIYHGNDGKNYAMPMEKEDGSWKVSSVTTIELWSPKDQSA